MVCEENVIDMKCEKWMGKMKYCKDDSDAMYCELKYCEYWIENTMLMYDILCVICIFEMYDLWCIMTCLLLF